MNNSPFKDIVGQEKPKKELSFYLNSYLSTRLIPNLMIVAPKGQGKTTLARSLAKNLIQFDEWNRPVTKPDGTPKKKSFVEINCSTLKSVKAFFNGLVLPHIQDKDVTLLFDEASEIPRDVSMALLTILNPNPENRTTFTHDEYTCDFDFRRQTWIFATSESNKVFHALADRLERITLEEYNNEQLASIVKMGIPDVNCYEDVLLDVATVLRGNARAAQKMASKIAVYLAGAKQFAQKNWAELKQILSIFPLGLNAAEINILRILADNPNGTSLTCLAAKTGFSRESLQKDVESYLLKNNLLTIETSGRQITSAGLNYLKSIEGMYA